MAILFIIVFPIPSTEPNMMNTQQPFGTITFIDKLQMTHALSINHYVRYKHYCLATVVYPSNDSPIINLQKSERGMRVQTHWA